MREMIEMLLKSYVFMSIVGFPVLVWAALRWDRYRREP